MFFAIQHFPGQYFSFTYFGSQSTTIDTGLLGLTVDQWTALKIVLGLPNSGTTPTGGILADIPKSGDTVQHQQVSDNGTDTVVVSIEKV